MKTIGRVLMLAAASTAATGCAAWQSIDITKENCLPKIGPKDAVVVIYFDEKADAPAANPAECYVPQGGSVTFVTPKGATEGFEIRFDKGNGTPSSDNDGDFVGKMQGASGYAAAIEKLRPYNKEEPAKNTYNYTIVIGSKKTDPSIIIDM